MTDPTPTTGNERGRLLESGLRGGLFALTAYLTLGSLFTLLFEKPPVSVQIVQLSHVVVGRVFIPVLIIYLLVHLFQTLGIKRLGRRIPKVFAFVAILVLVLSLRVFVLREVEFVPRRIYNYMLAATIVALFVLFMFAIGRTLRRPNSSIVVLGGLFTLATLFVMISGFWLAQGFNLYATGVYSARGIHLITAMLFVVLGLAHIRHSMKGKSAQPQANTRQYPWRGPIWKVGMPTLVVLLAGTAIAYRSADNPTEELRPMVDAVHPADKHFQRATVTQCGGCHPAVVRTWAISPHRHAANNPIFIGLLKRTWEQGGPDQVTHCLRCHAPHAPDPAKLSVEKLFVSQALGEGDDPAGAVREAFDAGATVLSFQRLIDAEGFKAGVHCISCHRTRIEEDAHDGDFESVPVSTDEFTFLNERWAALEENQGELPATPKYSDRSHSTWVANALVLSRLSAHKEQYGFASAEAKSCMPCHHQTLTEPTHGRLTDVLQDQFTSWEKSDIAAAGRDCKSCHAKRFRTSGSYTVADHRMFGGSTLLATLTGAEENVIRIQQFLEGRDPFPPQLAAEDTPLDRQPLLKMEVSRISLNGGLGIRVVTSHTGRIGHSFPNGPTDIIEVWLALRVKDAAGQTVLDTGMDAPPGALRLGHTLYDAQGVVISDHQLYRVDHVVDRGRILPGTPHSVDVALSMPEAQSPFEVDAKWLYRRASPKFIEMLTGKTTQLPIVTVASFSGEVK